MFIELGTDGTDRWIGGLMDQWIGARAVEQGALKVRDVLLSRETERSTQKIAKPRKDLAEFSFPGGWF